jgi:hypothetical protein
MQRLDVLWSKGIAVWCDRHGPESYPEDATEAWQGAEFFQEHYTGCAGLVWVRLSTRARSGRDCDLDSFTALALPEIRRPFVLITTDGDVSVPSQLRPGTVDALLESPWLAAWFTQNYDGTPHPKMHPWPIGLDLHTPAGDGDPGTIVDTLRRMRDKRTPAGEASRAVLCDLGVSLCSGERRNVLATLRDCPHVTLVSERVSRAEIWSRYASHTFVLSAPGNGLDCHRTYEALYLGSIVIMKSSSLDPIFRGLPVALVEEWREVLDVAALRRWRDQLTPLTAAETVWSKLSPAHWIEFARQRLQP